jgi:hypothetical protein
MVTASLSPRPPALCQVRFTPLHHAATLGHEEVPAHKAGCPRPKVGRRRLGVGGGACCLCLARVGGGSGAMGMRVAG